MQWSEDPFDELARELREGAGADLRAEAEITERQTHLGRLRRRSLPEAVTAAMHRGDGISVSTAGRTISGTVDHVGEDYLIVVTEAETFDVRLSLAALAFTRAVEGGHTTSAGSRSMKARLAEYEHTGESVRVVAPEPGVDIAGRISVVANDHVVVTDDGYELFVPIERIALVIRPRR